jgi:hypothetical protein
MTHIRYDTGTGSMTHSDEGWYDVTAQVGKRANKRANRNDITAVVSETCGHGAPACYVFPYAELHLNRSMMNFGDPGKVDLTDNLWRLEHPAVIGALEHETAHARWTRLIPFSDWEAIGATKRMVDVITTLEEPRIEGKAIKADGTMRIFIRAEALEIVGKDFKIGESKYGASIAAILFLARVDAGVLTPAEADPFRKAILEVLDEDTLDVLEPLWIRFLGLDDEDYIGMAEVAREWLEALDIDPDEEEDDEADLASMAMYGEGEGEGEGDEDGEGEGEGDLSKRVTRETGMAASKADEEVVERRAAERAHRQRKQDEADSKRRDEAEGPHKRAFPPSHGYTPTDHSHYLGSRQPTAEEVQAARLLAVELDKIHYHDRVATKTTRRVPPGRLRGRGAVAEAAATATGRRYDGELWKGKARKVVDSVPLTIGLACDISGSMSSAVAALSSIQYVLADAGHQIEANVSTVHFGTRVHGIMPAGTHDKLVRTYEAGAGWEAFGDAALALDKELNMLDGRGARLLVVLSDGHFVNAGHKAFAQAFVPLAMSRGVGVMFLDFTGSFHSAYGGVKINVRGLKPTQIAGLIGRVAVDEMKRLDTGL